MASLRQQHAAEHALLGRDVLRRGAAERPPAGRWSCARARRGTLRLLSSSSTDPLRLPTVRSNICLAATTDTASGRRPACPVPTTVGAGARSLKHRCGRTSGQPGDNLWTSLVPTAHSLWTKLWTTGAAAAGITSPDRAGRRPRAVDWKTSCRHAGDARARACRRRAAFVASAERCTVAVRTTGAPSSRSPSPRCGALVAEPLFLLADSAIVGRLGTVPLAGLGVAGGAARRRRQRLRLPRLRHDGGGRAPARRRRPCAAALRQGIDGLWLALLLGVLVAVVADAARAGRSSAAFGAPARRRRAGRDLPALGAARAARHARRPRRHRRAARAARHPHAAGRRRRRRRASTSCSTSCSSTALHLGIAGSALGTVDDAAAHGGRRSSAVVVRGAPRGRRAAATGHRAASAAAARSGVAAARAHPGAARGDPVTTYAAASAGAVPSSPPTRS